MSKLPENLENKLKKREKENALRSLPTKTNLVDFSSNDYLGFASNEIIYSNAFKLILKKGASQNGATGSRLLSGNHALYGELETYLASFFDVESALAFNSGYDANLGFFGAIPQRGDIVFYDELVHASIRDGILLGNAKSYKFKHNDLTDLRTKILSLKTDSNSIGNEVYIVTESVFSMDGDSPDMKELVKLSKSEGCHLVIDEAHAIGVYGKKGEGLVQQCNLHKDVFARIVTFGKAMGCHGAAIMGSEKLKKFLVNFARSFIYTTGLPPHSVATIYSSFAYLLQDKSNESRKKLSDNIDFFNQRINDLNLKKYFIPSKSAIHCCIISGNDKVKSLATKIQDKGFNARPIMSPTVPEGKERLRFCLHSFNSKEEMGLVLQILSTDLK